MLLLVGRCLGVVHRPLHKRVSRQEIRLFTKFNGVRTVFESCNLFQAAGVLCVLTLAREKNLINLEQSFLIIDKKVQKVISVLSCKL